MVVETEHPSLGHLRTLGSPIKMSATPPDVSRRAPRLGEHTVEVLGGGGIQTAKRSRRCARRARSHETSPTTALPLLLTRKGEFPARIPLPHREHFSVLDREGDDDVGEFFDAELMGPPRLEFGTAGASN